MKYRMLLAMLAALLSGIAVAEDVIEVRCIDWLRAVGREKEIRQICPSGGLVPVDAQWWKTLNECKQPANAQIQKCRDFARQDEVERLEAEHESAQPEKGEAKAVAFIALTPTEFGEEFNRMSRLYRLKYRMPFLPVRNGKMAVSIAQGVAVAVDGIDGGNGISRVTITCARIAGCDQAIVASALTIDPDADVEVLSAFIGDRLRGERPGQTLEMNHIAYRLDAARKSGKINVVIQAWNEE